MAKPQKTTAELALDLNEAVMKDVLLRSGYLLEKRVATYLRKSGYKVDSNRGFIDSETNKSREYDVYAHKEIEVYGAGSYGVYPTLICECKNNPFPTVFFAQEEETFVPLQDEIRTSGIPCKIWKRNKYISVQELTEVSTFHHYCNPKVPVATQYCNFAKKKDGSEWEALHSDESNDIFRTLAKTLEQEINADFNNMKQWFVPEEMEKEFIDLSFYYPVLILQGDIYSAHIEGSEEHNSLNFKKCDHVQYNPEYYSTDDNEVISYHLDIITEKFLPDYVQLIDEEMSKIKGALQQQKPSVMRSIDKIVAEISSLETKPTNYRKHLEYKF